MARVSDEAVQQATGRKWAEWFSILDKAGSKKKKHREIVRWLFDNHLGRGKSITATSPGAWWSQMVTVQYEQARGLREANQNETGYLVGVHKTFLMSPQEFARVWESVLRSKKVAAKKLERLPSKTTRNMLRYKGVAGGLVVTFDERPEGKLRVMVEAIKLPDKKAVERERAFWRSVLDGLE